METNNNNKSTNSYSELLYCLKSRFFLAGVALALLIWILDPFISAVFLHQGTIYQRLLLTDAHEAYMRTVISAVIIIMSFIGSFLLNCSKQAEEALQKSESQFRKLVENIHEVFWMENAEGTELLYVSPAYEQIWGRSCQSFYENPQDWINSIHTEDRERVVNAFLQFRESGIYSEEFRIVQPDGSTRWIWDRGFLIRNESGEIQNVGGIAEDITKRKLVETSLKESEERFRSFITSAPVCIHEIDLDGRLTSMNPCGLKMMNITDESEVCGLPYINVVIEEERPYVAELMSKAFDGHVSIFEFKVNTNGELKYYSSIFIPIKNTAGQVKLLMGITTDITERKQAVERLSHQASHDALTGLVNRRVLDQRLNDEIQRASRYKHILSVFMLDLDHFKSINDNYGHQTGDTVLRNFAKVLESSIRNTDYAVRYGGEEFIVILPETPLPKAKELAERLCNQIAESTFTTEDDKDLNLTVSIGIATYPEHAQSSQTLIEVADSVMYAAKKAGRNQVKTA